jgi:hypothetical protein
MWLNLGMRFRAGALVAALLGAQGEARAVTPRDTTTPGSGTTATTTTTTRIAAEHLTAMAGAGVDKPLRTHVAVRWGTASSAAWNKLATRASWQAAWDPATGVPTRIWGSGLPAPAANRSAHAAEAFARQVLAAHLDLLAPGSALGDFELVSNHDDGSVRSVGFIQRSSGRRVVGGQLSFRFKRDRLIAIASEALPHVSVGAARASIDALGMGAIHARASMALRRELDLPTAPVSQPGEEVVLPLVADHAVLGYRVVRALEIDGGADGRYLAYADAADGTIVAIRQQNVYATGTLQYRSVDRNPMRARYDAPAIRTHVQVSGVTQTTNEAGVVSWDGTGAQTVTTAAIGELARVVNKAMGGVSAAASLSLGSGGIAVWDASGNPEEDAQVQAYLAVIKAKEFVLKYVDPEMPKLGDQLTANVNIGQDCNAFFDGTSINFFQASEKCQNTAVIQDVVFHEFGHAMHAAEIIKGVGKFDGAMSEGAADFLASIITNDSGMGRGFFYNDMPLRELNPSDHEVSWPNDIGEIHHQGLIYGGAMWDLRTSLIEALGEQEGTVVVNKIFVGTLRRAADIPTSLIEALVTDDDDGNLANGTPHECLIRNAFGRHGLRTASGAIESPTNLDEPARATIVKIQLGGLSSQCAVDDITKVTVEYRLSRAEQPSSGGVIATKIDDQTYWAQLPLALQGESYYRAQVDFADGSTLMLPDNLADQYYEIYQGHTIPLYCTNFDDADPFNAGWTTGTHDGTLSPWQWGSPMGGVTDPQVAYSGSKLLAQAIGGEYSSMSTSYVQMPTIDVGRWSDVRLQYRRWLAVEDSHFDQARITVNGNRVWLNYTANNGDSSATHHIDHEWRFHDVGLSGWSPGHELTVAWDLTADEGLQLGGWALEDVCIVANIHSVCGDGIKSPTEGCDDGRDNANEPDRCRTYCLAPKCGDSIVDSNEECDTGSGDYQCTATCENAEVPGLGGCCSANRDVVGPLSLGALVFGLVVRRRRRRP